MANIDTTDEVLKQVKELHIENNNILHAIQNKPWWDSPLIYIIIGALLTFITQYIIFRLQKEKDLILFKNNLKKEIDSKVAELYGKLNALYPEYNITFYRYNCSDCEARYYEFLYNHYKNEYSQEEWGSDLEPEEQVSFLDKFKMLSEKAMAADKTSNERLEKCMEQKLKLMEILHQIHFYYKDDKLSNQINNFQNIYIHKAKFEVYNSEMENTNFLKNYIDKNAKPINITLKELSSSIFNSIRNLTP